MTDKYSSGMKRHGNRGKALVYIVLILIAVLFAYPFYFTFMSSLKSSEQIFQSPYSLPNPARWGNYAKAWEIGNMGTYLGNSFILAFGAVVVTGLIGSMAAYMLAKFKFKLRGAIYLLFLAGMMIPIQTAIIPLAYVFGKMRVMNSFPMMILLYTAFSLPMTVFIMTGFIKSVPTEIEEAAVIDGASAIWVYFKVIIPLSMPAMVSASIFNFLANWNNLLFPLVFLTEETKKTISIGLLSFFGIYNSDYGGVMAAITISVLPVMLIYILLQEKVEKGLTAGAVKG